MSINFITRLAAAGVISAGIAAGAVAVPTATAAPATGCARSLGFYVCGTYPTKEACESARDARYGVTPDGARRLVCERTFLPKGWLLSGAIAR